MCLKVDGLRRAAWVEGVAALEHLRGARRMTLRYLRCLSHTTTTTAAAM